MGHKKESFLQGNAFGLIVIDVIFIPLASLLPDWSIKNFFLNLIIFILSMGLAGYWYKTISNPIRYNSLVGFVVFISTGFFCVTPLLRITTNTKIFWVFLFLYLFVFIYSMIKRELIFQSIIMKPGKSKLSKAMIGFFIIIMLVGSLTARNGQEMVILRLLDDYQGLFFGSCIMYAIGLFCTFVSAVILRNAKEIIK